MRLYLDTEFNGQQGELISIALVCENPSVNSFYSHCYNPIWDRYDPWVIDNVVPVLKLKGVGYFELASEFKNYIKQFQNPEIICDWHSDAIHFCKLLEGETYEESLDFACRITILKTPPGEPKSLVPHNALADATALMEWHQNMLKEQG